MSASVPNKGGPTPAEEDVAVERAPSKWVVVAVIVVGGLGAIATAARPLLRQRYSASRGVVRTAEEAFATTDPVAAQAIADRRAEAAVLLERLRELQRAHQARHPLWYGRPTPELVGEIKEVLARKAADGAVEAPPAIASPADSQLR